MGENQTNHSSPEQDATDSASKQAHTLEHCSPESLSPPSKASSLGNQLFWATLFGFVSVYLLLIVAMLVADLQFTSVADLRKLFSDPFVQYSISLSVISSTIASIMAMWIAIPTGYWLARFDSNPSSNFARRITKKLIFALLDIPIVLPPIVVGISLLVLFQTPLGRQVDWIFTSILQRLGFKGLTGVTYEIPAVILAQFTVVTAFAIRIMRRCYTQIDPRPEQVARTLGASDYQAFAKVAFPQSFGGMVAAFTLAWARAIGEFGPVLIFAGTTRLKTEVLPSTIYLSFQSGDLKSAVSASMILISIALVVLIVVRGFAPTRILS